MERLAVGVGLPCLGGPTVRIALPCGVVVVWLVGRWVVVFDWLACFLEEGGWTGYSCCDGGNSRVNMLVVGRNRGSACGDGPTAFV